MRDKEIFYNISLLSLYMHFKEKYKNIKIDDSKKEKDLETVKAILIKLDEYQHLPNKIAIIDKAYTELLNCKQEFSIDEDKLFELVSSSVETLSVDKKKYILNSIILVAQRDNKISTEEKELILQISHLLGFKSNFTEIIKEFKKSNLSGSASTWKIIVFFIISLTIISAVGYYFYKDKTNTVKLFNNEKVVFSELSFNRYVLYMNTFDTFAIKYYLKQAVFYFDGSAEISFDPKGIKYNSINKELILSYPINIFKVNTSYRNILEIDKIDTEAISKEEARVFGGVLSIAGAGVGAVVGSNAGGIVGTLLPQFKVLAPIIGGVTGGVVGGAGTYLMASTLLDGTKISDDISKKEIEQIKIDGKKLINYALTNDEALVNMYKNSFETYIKAKYASVNLEIKEIKYEEVK